VDRIGRHRWPFAYPWAALRDAGARIAFSSDWPVSDVNPLRGIHAARTRARWAEDLPDQRLTLMETLAAYTTGGAHAGFAETETGRIAPGFHADLALLSADIEATPAPEIDRLSVDLTISAGRVVHRAEGFEG
jgi:predicted amidohydrolase YtcJ